jgi:hypothetical protein
VVEKDDGDDKRSAVAGCAIRSVVDASFEHVLESGCNDNDGRGAKHDTLVDIRKRRRTGTIMSF